MTIEERAEEPGICEAITWLAYGQLLISGGNSWRVVCFDQSSFWTSTFPVESSRGTGNFLAMTCVKICWVFVWSRLQVTQHPNSVISKQTWNHIYMHHLRINCRSGIQH